MQATEKLSTVDCCRIYKRQLILIKKLFALSQRWKKEVWVICLITAVLKQPKKSCSLYQPGPRKHIQIVYFHEHSCESEFYFSKFVWCGVGSSVWFLPQQTGSSLCCWDPGPAVEPAPTGSAGPGLPHAISVERHRDALPLSNPVTGRVLQ